MSNCRINTYIPVATIGLLLMFSVGSVRADTGNETIRTETTTEGTPQVIKSFMVPTMTQTKETTDSTGETTTTTAPMIMERHEQVVVPREQTSSETTIEKHPQVREERTEEVIHTTAPAKKLSAKTRAPHHSHTLRAQHHHSHIQVKTAQSTDRTKYIVKKTVIEEPTIIRHSEHAESNPIIYERKDPALEQ